MKEMKNLDQNFELFLIVKNKENALNNNIFYYQYLFLFYIFGNQRSIYTTVHPPSSPSPSLDETEIFGFFAFFDFFFLGVTSCNCGTSSSLISPISVFILFFFSWFRITISTLN